MRLKKYQITAMLASSRAFTGPEKVVKAGFKQVCRAGVTCNMTAQLGRTAGFDLIGLDHHGQRIPAHQRSEPFFERQIAGEHGLFVHRNRVEVGRGQFGQPANAAGSGVAGQYFEQLPRARGPLGGDQRFKRLAPFGGFLRVGVGNRACL